MAGWGGRPSKNTHVVGSPRAGRSREIPEADGSAHGGRLSSRRESGLEPTRTPETLGTSRSCVALGGLPDLSEFQFPYPQNGDRNAWHLRGFP